MATRAPGFFELLTLCEHDGAEHYPVEGLLEYKGFVINQEHGEVLSLYFLDIEDPWPGEIPQITADDLIPNKSTENWQAEYLFVKFTAIDSINAILGFDTMSVAMEGKTIISCRNNLIAIIQPLVVSPWN